MLLKTNLTAVAALIAISASAVAQATPMQAPAVASVPNPAPSVMPVADMTMDAPEGVAMAGGDTVTLGDLEIAMPFARATLPNQPVAGGFMTISNAGDSDDTLIAASSPAAGRMEVHEMAMDGDVMRMREVNGGLTIPAGETVTLQPGGYHIMFMDLAGPLAAGDSTDVTLTFENAGDVTVTLPIMARDAAGNMQTGHGGN